jgi:hypothetical protein
MVSNQPIVLKVKYSVIFAALLLKARGLQIETSLSFNTASFS